MGEYTFAEFCSRTKFQLGNLDELESPTNYYGIWVNAAYRQLCTRNKFFGRNYKRRFYFPQLETSTTTSTDTVDGTAYISVPDDCLVIREVYDTTNDTWLRNIPYRKYIGYTDRSDTDAEGEPTQWVRNGGYIFLHPTPDDEYTMEVFYRKVPPEISGTSTTLIGDEWDEVILDLAVCKGLKWMKRFDELEIYQQEVTDGIDGVIGVYDSENQARRETRGPKPSYIL